MGNIYNHVIFLSENARNDLHEGKEVEGQGFVTIINGNKKNLDFSFVKELVARYKINSNSKKSNIFINSNEEQKESFISINFNPLKLKLEIDDILNVENGGKQKICFSIIDKESISHISITDIDVFKNNYVFWDEINSFSEPVKI